uniref:Uncharacterized protein n=1 Tax=Arundo donax TaxID=35708 RepID=A0A0A9GZ07_ARUDO
MEFLFSSFWD